MEQVRRSPSSHTMQFQPQTYNEDLSATEILLTSLSNNKQHDNYEVDQMLSIDDIDQSSSWSMISLISDTTTTHDKQSTALEGDHFLQNDISKESTNLSVSKDDGLVDDISPPTQPMETNVEDDIHKLRLRLIDSEFKHQRNKKDDHTKQTHHHTHHVHPSSHAGHQQVASKVISRQISLSTTTPQSLSGEFRAQRSTRNGTQNHSDMGRNLENQPVQNFFDQRHRTQQPIMISNYTYDSRLYLQPVNEEHLYTSSNLDDLIDSMARRHLASRRHNSGFDQRQRYHSVFIEPLNSSLSSRQSQQRNDDIIYTTRSSRNETDRHSTRGNPNDPNPTVRPRVDHHNEIQPESHDTNNGDLTRGKSYTKLPPISNKQQNSNHSQTPSTTVHETKRDSNTLPLIAAEHLIKLPSDIFTSTKTEPGKTPRTHRKTRRKSNSKDTHSESEQSDDESTDEQHKKGLHNGYDVFFTEPDAERKKKAKIRRKLFQKAAIGVLFTIVLKHRAVKNRSRRPIQSPRAAIHKIRLQEILVALHRVYLEPDGPIYNALLQAIIHSISLQHALDKSSKHHLEAIRTIGTAVENIITEITQFMPTDGVLGTTKTSAISALLQNGNPYPENYFWQCERKHLEFDHLKLINITKQQAILLLIDSFIFRGLVTTLLIKPIKYRLILGQLTPSQSVSLKVLSSILLYLGRRVAGFHSQTLTLPDEWKYSLYTDADIHPIIEHSEIKSIMSRCEQSLRMWSEEYIRRINGNHEQDVPTNIYY